MGCVCGSEVIQYSIDDEVYIEPFKMAYNRVSRYITKSNNQGNSEYIDTSKYNIKVYDTNTGGYIQVKKFIKNKKVNNWRVIKFKDGQQISLTADHPLPIIGKGRTYVNDIEPGDKLEIADIKLHHSDNQLQYAWFLGLLSSGNTRYSYDGIELDNVNDTVVEKLKSGSCPKEFKVDTKGNKILLSTDSDYRIFETEEYCGSNTILKYIHKDIFDANIESKYEYIGGLIENASIITEDKKSLFRVKDTSKSFINSLYYLLSSLGIKATLGNTLITSGVIDNAKTVNIHYIDFGVGKEVLKYTTYQYIEQDNKIYIADSLIIESNINKIKEKERIIEGIEEGERSYYSYDVETETDRFDVSGIQSHNCRTRVMSNIFDPENETSISRGNLSFTTINLPRLAIKASKGIKGQGDINLFFSLLDEMMELVHKQLLERFEVQCRKHPRNYPFLMGQGVWIGTDKLGPDDDIRDVLKQGSLSLGFLGLAETLTMLIGKHHGESKEAQELGLKIIGHMRELTDKWSQDEKMNYGVIGTPQLGAPVVIRLL